MAKMFGTARLGSDMEVRFMPNGDPVGQVSLAFKLSKKDKQGQYMTQWISASLFGTRAEKIAPYLVKGSMHAFHLRDVYIEEYTKDGATKAVLKATIDDVELCGNKDAGQSAPQRQPEPQQGKPSSNFDDMADDVPF